MISCFASCSQCDYVAQFESALKMHQQLHHEQPNEKLLAVNGTSAVSRWVKLSPINTRLSYVFNREIRNLFCFIFKLSVCICFEIYSYKSSRKFGKPLDIQFGQKNSR